MKIIAHLVVSKDYNRAIIASQWIDECLNHCEEHNREYYGENYLSEPKDRATVTVEFEIPDSIFDREPVIKIPAILQQAVAAELKSAR